MKTLFKITVSLLLLTSCMTPLATRAPNNVVVDKDKNIFNGYFLKVEKNDKQTVIQVSRKEFRMYQVGDTIRRENKR